MTAVWLTKNAPVWYAVTLASAALLIGGLIALFSCVRARRGRGIVLRAGLNALISFVLFLILMDCARYAYLSEPDPRYQAWQIRLFELPWGVYAGVETVCAVMLARILQDDIRYRRRHLTPDAIRETVDLLPEGICISAPDGTVLLSNLRAEEVCRKITGGGLNDGQEFRRRIEETGEKQSGGYLARMPEGETWRFTLGTLTAEGETFGQVTAADISEQYRVTGELQEKNARLQEIQRRMKAVTDLSGEMFTAQEEANARAALHNQLGQVLLMGRHWLEHPESTDADMVRMATREMNRFLLGEADAPEGERTEILQQTLDMIRSIGVGAEIHGELPAEPSRRALLAQVIQECAINTVKHADGNRIDVEIAEGGEGTVIRVTNNGRPPQGPVAESGGLSALRRSVEEAGGNMTVESAPEFALTIIYNA